MISSKMHAPERGKRTLQTLSSLLKSCKLTDSSYLQQDCIAYSLRKCSTSVEESCAFFLDNCVFFLIVVYLSPDYPHSADNKALGYIMLTMKKKKSFQSRDF